MRRTPGYSRAHWVVAAGFAALASFSIAQEAGWRPAFAQSDGQSDIERKTAELREFQEQLRSDDYLVRLAAFEAGMASSDPIVRQIAFREAFTAADKDLQTLALRSWLGTRTTLIVQLTIPDKPSDELRRVYESYLGDSLVMDELSIAENGEIAAQFGSTQFVGEFIPAGVTLVGRGGVLSLCNLSLGVVGDRQLSGYFRCPSWEPIRADVAMQ